jgi:dTDP-4-dehydrorhamnose reductase
VPLPRSQLDLAQPVRVRSVVEKLRPAVVINCAAWTAVDAAESDPDACRRVNADAVAELAAACNDVNAMLVQISTDYVFGADAARTSPYAETDTPGPLNEYGASKLAGEQAAATASKHLIVRTCGLYSVGANGPVRGRNFADTVLALATEQEQLRIVNDQYCTPSFAPHVAEGILRLLERSATGLFHVVNSGATTWYKFASELFRVAGQTLTLHSICASEYPTPSKRPAYSVLDTTKFSASTGDALPPWQIGIQEYVRAMKPHSLKYERTACVQFL